MKLWGTPTPPVRRYSYRITNTPPRMSGFLSRGKRGAASPGSLPPERKWSFFLGGKISSRRISRERQCAALPRRCVEMLLVQLAYFLASSWKEGLLHIYIFYSRTGSRCPGDGRVSPGRAVAGWLEQGRTPRRGKSVATCSFFLVSSPLSRRKSDVMRASLNTENCGRSRNLGRLHTWEAFYDGGSPQLFGGSSRKELRASSEN